MLQSSVRLILGLTVVMVVGCGQTRVPFRFIFPADFRGFVFLGQNQPECAPLPVEDGFLVVRVDETGKACTSTSLPIGMTWDDQFFLGGEPQRFSSRPAEQEGAMVRGFWSGFYRTATGEHSYVCLFVGDDHEFSRIEGEICVPPEALEERRRLEAAALAESPD
jgi:hypothetical protein